MEDKYIKMQIFTCQICKEQFCIEHIPSENEIQHNIDFADFVNDCLDTQKDNITMCKDCKESYTKWSNGRKKNMK